MATIMTGTVPRIAQGIPRGIPRSIPEGMSWGMSWGIGATLWLVAASSALAQDRIALSCFGGVTGGGRVTFVTPDGTISRYDCHRPGRENCGLSTKLGSDPSAFARWTAALDQARFEAVSRQGRFGNVRCALLRERDGRAHSVGFDGLPGAPGGLPGAVATVVRELGSWHDR